jgi:pimeloyl-ACP methyl ester carboxylesterase
MSQPIPSQPATATSSASKRRRRAQALSRLGISLSLAAWALAGCGSLRPAEGPLEVQTLKADCTALQRTLVVLLPGVYSDPQDFVRKGFIRELRERRIAADAMLVDAHLGYYQNRSIAIRLQTDVIGPAHAAGYRSVWLAGISLGGFGALLHEELQPGQAAGLVLIAPYLGVKEMAPAIQDSGGLKQWQAPPGEDVNVRLWRWLQSYANQASPRPPLYLGFGLEDRFAPSHQLLAANLPPRQVFTTAGGHDWPQWQQLWRQMLDTLPLPRCETPVTAAAPQR